MQDEISRMIIERLKNSENGNIRGREFMVNILESVEMIKLLLNMKLFERVDLLNDIFECVFAVLRGLKHDLEAIHMVYRIYRFDYVVENLYVACTGSKNVEKYKKIFYSHFWNYFGGQVD
jgi:hypothetical protein